MKNTLQKGPLNKNFSTHLCDNILKILLDDKRKSEFRIVTGEIILVLPSDEKDEVREYNITLLFRYTNFQQLAITKETLAHYQKYLEGPADLIISGLDPKVKTRLYEDKTLPQLTVGEKTAISIYTKSYEYFNSILRGKSIPSSLGDALKDSEEDLSAFLKEMVCAILIASHGITKLQGRKERPVFRIEEKNDSIQDLLQQRILATSNSASKNKILTCQGFYSTSENGFSFAGYETKDIFLQINTHQLPISSLSWNEEEEEVILPPHSQILFSEHFNVSNFHIFTGQVVCSPDGIVPDKYLPDHALRFALNDLKRPYSQGYLFGGVDDYDIVNGIRIERPNHGLIYALCMRNLIKPVTLYLSNHAKNQYLRSYCQDLTDAEINLLESMAPFLKIGRESEISFSIDNKAYDRYQQKSAEKFLEYSTKFHYLFAKNDLKVAEIKEWQDLAKVVQSYGDPNFWEENSSNKFGCMAKILDICHNLHLQRSWELNHYKKMVKSIKKKISITSSQQKKDLLQLLLLSQAFIVETGCNFSFIIDKNGKYLDQSRGKRQAPFDICSVDPDKCHVLLTAIAQKFSSAYAQSLASTQDRQALPSQSIKKICEIVLDDAFDLTTQPLSEEKYTLHDVIIKEIRSEIFNFAASNLSLIRLLLAAGADINAIGSSGKTPLELVGESQHTELTKLLLTQIQTDDAKSKPGRMLMEPVKESKYTELSELYLTQVPIGFLIAVVKGAEVIHKAYTIAQPALILHELLGTGSFFIIRHLILKGFPLNGRNAKGQTFFLYLIEQHQKFVNSTRFRSYKELLLLILKKNPACTDDKDFEHKSVLNYIMEYPAAIDPEIYREMHNLGIRLCRVKPIITTSPIYSDKSSKKRRAESIQSYAENSEPSKSLRLHPPS